MKTIDAAGVRGINLFVPKSECTHAVRTGVDMNGRAIWTPATERAAHDALVMGAEVREISRKPPPGKVWVEKRKNSFVLRQDGVWLDQYSDRSWAEHAANLIRNGATASEARERTWEDLH